MRALSALFGRELGLVFGRGGGPLVSVGFLACVTAILPLAAGPAPERLAPLAAGAAFAALALSTLLGLERLFERDLRSGALDLIALGPVPLEAVAGLKCLAHWLINGLPLSIAAPLAAIALGAPAQAGAMIGVCAAIGGLAFAFVGGMGAALALASRQGGVLIALIVLPLIVPPVIFGGQAMAGFATGASWAPALGLLCAYALAAIALAPIAMAAACRNALG